MKRLIDEIVFSGFVTACRLATCPTRRSPSRVKATTDGVVRAPSWFTMTVGWPPSITAPNEFVLAGRWPVAFPGMWPLSWTAGRFAIPRRFAIHAEVVEQRVELFTQTAQQLDELGAGQRIR